MPYFCAVSVNPTPDATFSMFGGLWLGGGPPCRLSWPKPACIYRIAQNASCFLRRVEAHGILRHHEVDHELAFTLMVACISELSVRGSLCFFGL